MKASDNGDMQRCRARSTAEVALVAAFLLAAGLAACAGDRSGDDAAEGPAGAAASMTAEAAGAAARTSTGAPRDACALIPVEQVAAIVGGPVVTTSDPGPHESGCAYTDEGRQLLHLGLTVYWDGGREMLEIVQMGTGIAARMMAERPGDQAAVDSIVRPGAVEGLGDVALFSDILPSYVLTGDVLLEMHMPLLPDAKQHFRPLASTALGRLRSVHSHEGSER